MKDAIFVFTKESPQNLINCLTRIKGERYKLHVIDDSYSFQSIKENKQLLETIPDSTYLGLDDFRCFYGIEEKTTSNMGDTFATSDWNLGNCRNFGLDYSKRHNYQKVLFIDHDILIKNYDDIGYGFGMLDGNNFVSFEIQGMEDDSIVGHISKRVNFCENNIKLLSGGFLFFQPLCTYAKFPNIYNEDWIFQLVEFNKNRLVLPRGVVHQMCNPYADYKNRVLFQEFGEIFVTGLLDALRDTGMPTPTTTTWENTLQQRIDFLKQLEKRLREEEEWEFHEIINFLICNYLTLDHSKFHQFYQNYSNSMN